MDPQAAEPRLGGGVDGHGEKVPGDLVQNEILPPAGVDVVSFHPGQGGDPAAEEPGGIDEIAGGEHVPSRRHGKALGEGRDGGDFMVQEKSNSVGHGVLRQGHGV